MNPKLKKQLGLHRPKTTTSLIMGAILLKLVFLKYIVATGSMEPTVPVGSLVFSFRWASLFGAAQTAGIVIFNPVEGISQKPWVHRVIWRNL